MIYMQDNPDEKSVIKQDIVLIISCLLLIVLNLIPTNPDVLMPTTGLIALPVFLIFAFYAFVTPVKNLAYLTNRLYKRNPTTTTFAIIGVLISVGFVIACIVGLWISLNSSAGW